MTTQSPIRPANDQLVQDSGPPPPPKWRERLGRIVSSIGDFVVAMRDAEARTMPRSGKIPPFPRS